MSNRITWMFIAAFTAILVAEFVWGPTSSTIQAITALIILVFGAYTYLFQARLAEHNRISRRPSIVVRRSDLENNKEIIIENTDSRIEYEIYISSFLFSRDGSEYILLFDEIQAYIAQQYPVNQANILKPNFRSPVADEDKSRYGSQLSERFARFISDHTGQSLLLIIGLHSPLYEPDEAVLFIYETDPINSIDDATWKSVHVDRGSPVYQNALTACNKSYGREKQRTKSQNSTGSRV